jgi:Na+-driven multidrug efflux pump
MLIYNFGSSVLRSKGDTKRPLYFLTLAGIINVILNLIFVIVFHMDVAGVALATVISQCVSATLIVLCLVQETDAFRFDFKQLKPHKEIMIKILQIGIPAVMSIYFDVFSGCLQAYIFAMLTMMYVAGGFPYEDYLLRKEKRDKKRQEKNNKRKINNDMEVI